MVTPLAEWSDRSQCDRVISFLARGRVNCKKFFSVTSLSAHINELFRRKLVLGTNVQAILGNCGAHWRILTRDRPGKIISDFFFTAGMASFFS